MDEESLCQLSRTGVVAEMNLLAMTFFMMQSSWRGARGAIRLTRLLLLATRHSYARLCLTLIRVALRAGAIEESEPMTKMITNHTSAA